MATRQSSSAYSKAPAMLAGLALVALAACLYFNFQARGAPSQRCTLETLQASAAAASKAQPFSFDPIPADLEGVLRVVYLPAGEHRVGQSVCLALAGVSLAAQRLIDDEGRARKALDDAGAVLAKAQNNLTSATPDARAAAKAEWEAATQAAVTALAAYQAALDKRIQGPPTVELTPFLNGYRADAAKTKVQATDRAQAVELQFGSTADASAAVATFWRNALSGGTDDWSGAKAFSIGLTRNDSGNSELQKPPTVTFRIYDLAALRAGAAAMLLLTASLALLAARSRLLRDNSGLYTEEDVRQTQVARDAADAEQKKAEDAAENARNALKTAEDNFKKVQDVSKANNAPLPQPDAVASAGKDVEAASKNLVAKAQALEAAKKSLLGETTIGKPSGAWSLGRTQMALWMLIVVGGFLFLWLSLGEYSNVINSSILILLGLSSATGLLAVQADQGKNAAARSKGFLSDLINDGNGPQLQRIQVIIWTIVLAIVFLYNLAYNFMFVQFDANLLLLMGIAQATYVGFKTADKEPAKDGDAKP